MGRVAVPRIAFMPMMAVRIMMTVFMALLFVVPVVVMGSMRMAVLIRAILAAVPLKVNRVLRVRMVESLV